MDHIDLKILKLLQDNSRITNINIAKETGLTPPSTLERVRKLEEAGIIKGYVTKFNEESLGYKIKVFVAVTLILHDQNHIQNFLSKIKNISEVVEFYHTTGEFDYLLKIYTTDICSLQNLLVKKLTAQLSISRAKTLLILDEYHKGIWFEDNMLENNE